MDFDADTRKDIELTLSFVEEIVLDQFKEIGEEKKARIEEILKNPERYYVDDDTLMIHCENPLLGQYRGDMKTDIPFERIQTVDLIGDGSKGFYNAVYLEKTARFLFPNAMKFLSSSAYYHFDAFKKALGKRMEEPVNSYETLWFGFSYGGDLYTLEYIGDYGLDVTCACHPFANTSFSPFPLSIANLETPDFAVEARYVRRLTIKGEGIVSLSSFRQSLYGSGVECLLDDCESLEEVVIEDECPIKDKIIKLAEERGIKVVE